MFIILGLLILIVSFVIALVSLIGEQRQIAKVREKMAPDVPSVSLGESGQKELEVDQKPKTPDEREKEIYPWDNQSLKVDEGRGRKFDKVTISIKDLANSSKRELDT